MWHIAICLAQMNGVLWHVMHSLAFVLFLHKQLKKSMLYSELVSPQYWLVHGNGNGSVAQRFFNDVCIVFLISLKARETIRFFVQLCFLVPFYFASYSEVFFSLTLQDNWTLGNRTQPRPHCNFTSAHTHILLPCRASPPSSDILCA